MAAALAHSSRSDGRPGSQRVTLLIIVRDPVDRTYLLQSTSGV